MAKNRTPEQIAKYRATRTAKYAADAAIRDRAWAQALQLRYGLTVEEYDAMLEAQGGVCAICGEKCSAGRRLSVDHSHACCPGPKSCGACVRALLCMNCNQGIGKLKDNPDLLEAAAEYLRGF